MRGRGDAGTRGHPRRGGASAHVAHRPSGNNLSKGVTRRRGRGGSSRGEERSGGGWRGEVSLLISTAVKTHFLLCRAARRGARAQSAKAPPPPPSGTLHFLTLPPPALLCSAPPVFCCIPRVGYSPFSFRRLPGCELTFCISISRSCHRLGSKPLTRKSRPAPPRNLLLLQPER